MFKYIALSLCLKGRDISVALPKRVAQDVNVHKLGPSSFERPMSMQLAANAEFSDQV
jgi:hypothetical protein